MGIVDELQKLEQLRQNGTLTDEEFKQAKSHILANPSGSTNSQPAPFIENQLAAVRHQNELAQIDREWEIEQRQFQMIGRYGRAFTPTIGMGIATAVVGGIFGTLWTVMAMSITSASSGIAPSGGVFALMGTIFPLMGVLFTLTAVGRGVYCVVKAQSYNEAYAAYKERRLKASVEHEPVEQSR